MKEKLKRFFRWLKDKISQLDIPDTDLPQERADEIIEKWSKQVSKKGMEMVALTLGSGIEPISTVASQMVLMPLVPFLEFIGVNGYEYVAFFKNKENVRRLFRRIEELQEAKAQMIL